MTETTATGCYRDRDNGVYFRRNEHRHDCTDPRCRGCVTCTEPHCSARRNCAWHVTEDAPTCARCLAAARRDLRWISPLASLLLPAAMSDGVNSEAANLAGPAPDPRDWSERRIAMRAHLDAWQAHGRITEAALMHAREAMEDDDEHHPARVLGTWAMMLTEDYDHPMPRAATLGWCAGYLDRMLHVVAQDAEQDFPLMARELRKCRQHIEAVLHNDDRPDRGAPCPACHEQGVEKPPRLRLERGHWCEDEGCERVHHADDSDDVWTCPRDREHRWAEKDYRLRVVDWHEEAVRDRRGA